MLDLTQVAAQIGEAGRREAGRATRVALSTALARSEIQEHNLVSWQMQVARIRNAKTSWLVAHSEGLPGFAAPCPEPPRAYVVVAADGSQVAPDRHEGVGATYLLNVGRVLITYGPQARARLDSIAEIIVADDGDDEAAAAHLSQHRFGREMTALSALITETADNSLPAVALMDGSLIAWFLEDQDGKDKAKGESLQALRAMLESARTIGVPVAGYISSSGSRDVVNAIGVTLCPENPVDCNKCPFPAGEKPCEPVLQATDAQVFSDVLRFGERSQVFSSREQSRGFSKILRMYDSQDWIDFFYLNVGPEIARIEIPRWVADDPNSLDLIHAVCLDQAVKGRGYPVALAEAHESAVIRGADRDAFLNMLRRAMVKAGRPVAFSRKSLAKNARAV